MTKLAALRALAQQRGLDAIWLRRTSSFAWATDGAASYVETAVTEGAASLLVTADAAFVLTDNIEAPRLEREEGLAAGGFELLVRNWFEPPPLPTQVAGRIGCDVAAAETVDLTRDIRELRSRLTPDDVERLRACARLCGEAMDATMRALVPGDTEHEISGRLAREARRRGVVDVVNLVAVDERINAFRHPLPTHKPMQRRAMAILCGRHRGVIAALTRFVSRGPVPSELRRRVDAVARVDAAMIEASRPGRTLADVLRVAIECYAEVGFPDEWRLHHQGGTIGYESRESIATPTSTEVLQADMACAWNPSITGAKSEDTILVTDGEPDVLTAITGWPAMELDADIPRPDVLELA